jgi:KDO2-lipid IV(A) lauroyltransferase
MTSRPAHSPSSATHSAQGRQGGAARFWLTALFWSVRKAPWLIPMTRPLVPWAVIWSSRPTRQATDANARRIFGPNTTKLQRRRFGRRVVSSFFDVLCDVGRSLDKSPDELGRRIASVEGDGFYQAARRLGRGAIVVTAHMGSFEVGLAALLRHERRVHVVFRRDRIDWFEQLRSSLRQRLGIIEAPVDDGWGVWMGLRDALLNNEVVVLQGDRVMPGQKGRAVPMFGGHIMLPTGPVKLALASGGAPIVPVFSEGLSDGRIRIIVEEAILVDTRPDAGIETIDQPLRRLAGVIERHIRARPEQWLVLDRAFREEASPATAIRDQATPP